MAVPKNAVKAAYQRHARNYDLAMKLYRLIGLRIEQHRAHAAQLLHLKPGDCVLDLGCGTGLSFPLLMQQIGPEGRLIGVDLSSEMLACAQKRAQDAGWENVELVESDLSDYHFPENVNGVLSTGVFGYLNDREQVLEKIRRALVPGGRLAIVDGKRPDKWPRCLFKLFVWVSSPFGLTEEYFDARTWELVNRDFRNTSFEEFYGGMLYISVGMVSDSG